MPEDLKGMDALFREMEELGPLMAQQERLGDVVPDPVFAATLRSRLLADAPSGPSKRVDRRKTYAGWMGLAAAALVAAIATLVVILRAPHRSDVRTALWSVPTPGANYLTKSYPLPGGLGAGGPANPVVSRIDVPQGAPYTGHLRVTGGPLPSEAANLPAYQLAPASFSLSRVSRIAAQLKIHGRITRKVDYEILPGNPRRTSWVVVAQGNDSMTSPLRSIAISSTTGRLIFHDTTFDSRAPGSQSLPDRPAAISDGRIWLERIDWPGRAMPLLSLQRVPVAHMYVAEFGWVGVRSADTPAATLWIGPRGIVIEALLWPPVSKRGTVQTTSVSSAFALVRQGRIPVGVGGMVTAPPGSGIGRVTGVTISQILSAGSQGSFYLVPAYRFHGIAHLQGSTQPYPWVALVPAEKGRGNK